MIMRSPLQPHSRQQAPSVPIQSGLLQRNWVCSNSASLIGNCRPCQTKAFASLPSTAKQEDVTEIPTVVHEVLNSPGQPLDPPTRTLMESRFGHDFSRVQVHTDAKAEKSAQAVNALAYTVGHNIVFGAEQYAPATGSGKRLLAHELTHVVQQQAAPYNVGSILTETRAVEQEAEKVSQEIATGGTTPQIRQQIHAVQLSRQKQPTVPARASQRRLRFDILGADMSVKDANIRAATQALDTDMRVTSIENMIAQLTTQAGPSTGRCVEHLTIWNHGSPGGQALVGTETIRTRSGQTIRLPYSGLNLDWLLREGNQRNLEQLRNVFCCDGAMRWLGCGTAGVEAAGGARTQAQQTESRLRFETFGNRYRDAQDAATHGASLLGATFGSLNVQSWADATCTTITANTDFVYIDPANPRQLFRAQYGGQFVAFPPSQTGHCICNPDTGRPQGNWTITEAQQLIRGGEEATVGGDYLWHLYLNTFHQLWGLRNRSSALRTQTVAALLRLIREAMAGVTVPGGLPVTDVHPWVNIDTANPNWAALTSPHLVFCFPDNSWRWVMINQKAIQTTPSYTQQVLSHELLHAADMWSAAQEYRRLHGNPPNNTDLDRCRPVEEGVRQGWTDSWGQYINSFFDFYQNRLTALRHEEIYAEAVTPYFDRMTFQEKLEWFAGVLQNIPPDLPANQTFEAEQMVLRLFRNPIPAALREEMVQLLLQTTQRFVLGDASGQSLDRKRGRSLLQHFQLLWRSRLDQRRILLQAAQEEE